MARLDAPGADFVAGYCGMEIEGTGETRYVPDPAIPHRSGAILPSLISQSFISPQTLIVRRDLLTKQGGFDEDLKALVDWELMLRIAPEGPVDLVDEPLVVQRFSENSITRSSARRVAVTVTVSRAGAASSMAGRASADARSWALANPGSSVSAAAKMDKLRELNNIKNNYINNIIDVNSRKLFRLAHPAWRGCR